MHLLLVDIHRRPVGFSFPDRIAAALFIDRGMLPAPSAVSYRVGEPAAAVGRYLAIWRRALSPGEPLPPLPLPLSLEESVEGDLERTYEAAAVDAHLG